MVHGGEDIVGFSTIISIETSYRNINPFKLAKFLYRLLMTPENFMHHIRQ